MGSGGPRGLQILVSGTFGVRGGFDSHAFPPCFPPRGAFALAVLLLAAACVPVAHAQAAGDSARAVPRVDVVGGPAASPVPARADTARKQPWHEQPRVVMLRSLLIPGWGQLHNRAWFKAVLVAGGEGYLGTRIVRDQRELDRLLRELDAARAGSEQSREAQLVNEYNARLEQRLGRQWWFGAALAYALIDAYVDANFRGFDVEFQNDPALPAGAPPVPAGNSDRFGVRLLLRRHF